MKHFLLALFACTLALPGSGYFFMQADRPVVRAVLFYSPTCPHCHKVIEEVLMPLLDQYGEQLNLVGIDISTYGGSILFDAAIKQFGIPSEQQGVPMLFVGETVLIGSLDIPDQFPGLIEQYLAADGADWPAIPGLLGVLATAEPQDTTPENLAQTPVSAPTTTLESTPSQTPTSFPGGMILPVAGNPGIGTKLAQDPTGNALAILVLGGMLISVVYTIGFMRSAIKSVRQSRLSASIPILCMIGIVIAGYLTYIETTHAQAVCGPIGDCNTVQQSAYARLFGFLPVGLLGFIGYLVILVVWISGRRGKRRISQLAAAALFGITFFGTLFSIYLTILEPFVIGATCAWCLSSAVIMTALLWFTTSPGKQAFGWLRENGVKAGK